MYLMRCFYYLGYTVLNNVSENNYLQDALNRKKKKIKDGADWICQCPKQNLVFLMAI